MTDLMSILSTGNANIKLEITGEDLRNFSEELISRAVNEVAMVMQDNKEDCLLTKEETKKRLGVCDATLWHWDKKGYLKPVKVGSKVKYRESDVKKILGVQNNTLAWINNPVKIVADSGDIPASGSSDNILYVVAAD